MGNKDMNNNNNININIHSMAVIVERREMFSALRAMFFARRFESSELVSRFCSLIFASRSFAAVECETLTTFADDFTFTAVWATIYIIHPSLK